MHDPCTVAFDIRSPFVRRSHQRPDGTWWHYRKALITIWHVDPESDGSDDSCGWTWVKATDADRERIKRIAEQEYDCWLGKHASYACGGVGWTAYEVVWWAWCVIAISHGRNCWAGLTPAEDTAIHNLSCNPHDNIRSTVLKAATDRDGFATLLTCVDRLYRTHHRPWWKHPRWHIRHWRIQVHPWQTLRRWLFTRCEQCGKRFAWGASPVSHGWDSPRPKWFKGEVGLFHGECSAIRCAVAEKARAEQVH
jgi:hypothetical protein